jgi:T5orf172 domain
MSRNRCGHGLWRSATAAGVSQLSGIAAPASDLGITQTLESSPGAIEIVESEPAEEVVAEKTIGEGAEVVYVYFNPNDRELAQLRGRKVWECKIGRSATGSPVDRIVGQGAKTALSHPPVIGLVIRTDDSSALEKALHASLRLVEQRVPDSPGVEWFYSSPSRIESWHATYQRAVAYLGEDLVRDRAESPEGDAGVSR